MSANFGTASLGTPVRKKRVGKWGDRAPKYDCGEHGRLTAVEIASRAGLHRDSILRRVSLGVVGEALLAPKNGLKLPVGIGPTRPTIVVACKLAQAFPDRVPTAKQIQAIYPLSPRAARRWRDAWREALGGV